MASLPSPSGKSTQSSRPLSATSRTPPFISVSEPRHKVPYSRSSSLSDGETFVRTQSMYIVPANTEPEAFCTIPLTPYSSQNTVSGTPQQMPRSSSFSTMDATKQSPSYKQLTPLQSSPRQTSPRQSSPRQTSAPRSSEVSTMDAAKQVSPYKSSMSPARAPDQSQYIPIHETPKLTSIMRIRKLPMPEEKISSREVYSPTQSMRTLPSVSKSSRSSTYGQRGPSAVPPDSLYFKAQEPSRTESMLSDGVFLHGSSRKGQPKDSRRDTVLYEAPPIYYNEGEDRDPTYDILFAPPTPGSTSEPSPVPPIPPRPLKIGPPVAQKPDYLHSRNPFAKPGPPDPFMGSGAVVGLTKKTFRKFIKDLDAAFVMFYNPCDQKCCGAKVTMRQAAHTTQKENHAYAAVDCTKECELCRMEKVVTLPTMKLYVKGITVDTYEHVQLMSSEIRRYVEQAPLVREVELEKNKCSVQ